VEAVTRELLGRNIIADTAGFCVFRQQVANHLVQLLLCSDDLLVSMASAERAARLALELASNDYAG